MTHKQRLLTIKKSVDDKKKKLTTDPLNKNTQNAASEPTFVGLADKEALPINY